MNRIEIFKGNIVTLDVDAIVNAANSSLLGGGGVDGAIHRAAGPDLEFECRMLNGCKTGEAKITAGHRLKARHIIHTVGPVWRDGKHREAELLKDSYQNSLLVAEQNEIRTVAFPAISCGVYGFPIPQAASIAWATVSDFLETHPTPEKVIFCCFDENVHLEFQRVSEEEA